MKDSTYVIWRGILSRCLSPKCHNYKRYGGRGITVDPSWRDFSTFLADMGDRPAGKSIDRIDNNKGYSKDNCRWATTMENNQNMRTNRLLTHNGETKCLSQWARDVGLANGTLTGRLRRGWPLAVALMTPPVAPHEAGRGGYKGAMVRA